MSLSKLGQLKQWTTVVADTGEIDAIAKVKPEDATTNPTLVLKAIQSGKYEHVIEKAVVLANTQFSTPDANQLADSLAVNLGVEILNHIPGLISTEVDARLSFDMNKTLDKARSLISLYEAAGISKDRVLIKIASTWEGIQAASILEKEGIHCNLTLLFGFEQALACAHAQVTLISPFVGRILDWYKNNNPEQNYEGENDPGVISVADIYNYYKDCGVNTVVMGASFRSQQEIENLAGCDKLTISPALIESLDQDMGTLTQKLKASDGAVRTIDTMTEAEFRLGMNNNAMATEKLAEGIRGFIKDQESLEALLAESYL